MKITKVEDQKLIRELTRRTTGYARVLREFDTSTMSVARIEYEEELAGKVHDAFRTIICHMKKRGAIGKNIMLRKRGDELYLVKYEEC